MNSKPARLQRRWLPLLCSGALCLAPWSLWAQQPPVPPDPASVPEPPTAPEPPVGPQPPIASPKGPPASNQTEMTVQVEERKLDQFADAFVVVQEIQRSALQRLEQASDEQAASQLKAQAESDAIAAVEKTGLQLVEFNRIAQAMMTDVGLRDKVAARVAQRRTPTLPTS
jgi:hypothetical protein